MGAASVGASVIAAILRPARPPALILVKPGLSELVEVAQADEVHLLLGVLPQRRAIGVYPGRPAVVVGGKAVIFVPQPHARVLGERVLRGQADDGALVRDVGQRRADRVWHRQRRLVELIAVAGVSEVGAEAQHAGWLRAQPNAHGCGENAELRLPDRVGRGVRANAGAAGGLAGHLLGARVVARNPCGGLPVLGEGVARVQRIKRRGALARTERAAAVLVAHVL